MIRLPCFYYPTTALFVDDHKGFLTAIKSRLPDNLPVKLFNEPIKALTTIKNQKMPTFKDQKTIQFVDHESDITDQSLIGLHYEIFSSMAFDIQRFATYSVVIVDHMMPDLDGISFCRELKDHPIKKIMLTGNSDHELAVQAFNDGLIDYYLSKDSPNLITQLNLKIQILQKAYFESEIERSIGLLLNPTSLINDVSSLAFYEKIKEELKATEFYLLDRWGSMLFLDRNGVPTTLAITPAETLDAFSKIAEDHDETKISCSLSNREQILFFPNQEDHMRPANEWDSFLHEANPFPGRNDFFYSIISNSSFHPTNLTKIKSQNNYMEISP